MGHIPQTLGCDGPHQNDKIVFVYGMFPGTYNTSLTNPLVVVLNPCLAQVTQTLIVDLTHVLTLKENLGQSPVSLKMYFGDLYPASQEM